MQCDFDTIGTRSVAADIETALVIHDLLRAIGFADFTIRVNNRMVLTGLLERLGLADRATAVLRALGQAGQDRAGGGGRGDGFRGRGDGGAGREQVLRLSEIAGGNDEVLRQVEPLVAGSETGQAGVAKLKEVLDGVAAAGVPGGADPARRVDRPRAGLLHRHDLRDFLGRPAGHRQRLLRRALRQSGRAVHRQELPGIGASLGLDRLLAAMEELGMIEKVSTPAPVFIPYFDKDRLHDYLRLAAAMRAGGHRRGSVSRRQEARPATEVCRPPRLPRRPDRRRQRVSEPASAR